MEAPSDSGNPTKPIKGRRVEPAPLAPPLPEDCTKVPFVLDMIRKSNAAVTSKNRIKNKQSLTSEAVRHSLLLKDRHLGEEIIRDSITVRQIFPKPDVAITPILHALYCAKEYKRGEALFYWVLGEAKATSPEKEMLMMDDAVLTVGLRLIRAAGSTGDENGTIDTSNVEIKRLLANLDIPRKIDAHTIMYSTIHSSDKFSNPFTGRAIANLLEFDAAEAEAARLQAEHDEIEAAKPPKVITEIHYDENGDEIPPKPKKKKEIKAEAEARKIDVERYQRLMTAHHKAETLSGKVRNSKAAHSIRVEHVA